MHTRSGVLRIGGGNHTKAWFDAKYGADCPPSLFIGAAPPQVVGYRHTGAATQSTRRTTGVCAVPAYNFGVPADDAIPFSLTGARAESRIVSLDGLHRDCTAAVPVSDHGSSGPSARQE